MAPTITLALRGIAMFITLWLSLSLAGRAADASEPCSPHGSLTGWEARYVLNVRVKPLLFWIRRDGVGEARVSQARDAAGVVRRTLLVGSDPALAPMRINRWGYIAETTCDASFELVGLMTESREESVNEARRAATDAPDRPTQAFHVIAARVEDGHAISRLARLTAPAATTFRGLDALLQRMPADGGRVRQLAISAGTEPGFLAAVASALDEAARRSRQGALDRIGSRIYVYDGQLFDLRVRRASAAADAASERVLTVEFETGNRAGGKVSRFLIVTPLDGPRAGVPTRIVYSPRWWFEAELVAEPSAPVVVAQR